ncbi:hypothetical protein ACIOJE_37515 [Kitasatospora sp. NPDC087861]|uniref:hypothetical protein n=1 Tax=Kitasatospora sp. NPDC087861 TaxID=3364070 RepID=UPI00381FC089
MTQLERNCPAALLLPEGPVTDTAAVLAAARGLHAWDPRRPAVGQLLEHLPDHGDDARAQVSAPGPEPARTVRRLERHPHPDGPHRTPTSRHRPHQRAPPSKLTIRQTPSPQPVKPF